MFRNFFGVLNFIYDFGHFKLHYLNDRNQCIVISSHAKRSCKINPYNGLFPLLAFPYTNPELVYQLFLSIRSSVERSFHLGVDQVMKLGMAEVLG